jgi:hypothetical protein
MTVQTLVTTILATCNAVAAGETPAPEDNSLAQEFLNALIDSWNAEFQKAMAATFAPSLFTYYAVAQTVNLTDALTLPAGWLRALIFNTAVDLFEPYGKPVNPTVVAKAQESKAAIFGPIAHPGTET